MIHSGYGEKKGLEGAVECESTLANGINSGQRSWWTEEDGLRKMHGV